MPYNSSLDSSLTCGSLLHVSFLFILHAALHCSNKSKNPFKNTIVLKSYTGSHIMHLVRPYELSHCFHSPVLTLLENLVSSIFVCKTWSLLSTDYCCINPSNSCWKKEKKHSKEYIHRQDSASGHHWCLCHIWQSSTQYQFKFKCWNELKYLLSTALKGANDSAEAPALWANNN